MARRGRPPPKIDLGDAESVAKGLMEFERANLTWNGARAYVPKNLAKLVLNVLIVANASVPRGHTVTVDLNSVAPDVDIVIRAEGTPLRVPARFVALINGQNEEPIDAHGVQPYYALLLAQETGLDLTMTQEADAVTFTIAGTMRPISAA